MFDGDENIGPPFLEGDGLAHVRSPHFIDLVGDDGSVVRLSLGCARRDGARASRSLPSPGARGEGSSEPRPSALRLRLRHGHPALASGVSPGLERAAGDRPGTSGIRREPQAAGAANPNRGVAGQAATPLTEFGIDAEYLSATYAARQSLPGDARAGTACRPRSRPSDVRD